jgi:hypothetical protein
MKRLTVGTVILGGLMFAACGGAETKPAENTAPKPAAPATPTTTPTSVTTPAGNASTGSLPADFPKDVPIYAGAQIVSAATTGGTVGAVLSTADTPEKVTDFYKSELEKNGWAKPQAVNAAGTSTMTATKEKRRVSVGITKGADGKTSISIGVTAMP